MSFLLTFICLAVLTVVVYYGFGWMKGAFGGATPWIAAVLVAVAFAGLVKYSVKFPELDTSTEILELPEPGPTIKALIVGPGSGNSRISVDVSNSGNFTEYLTNPANATATRTAAIQGVAPPKAPFIQPNP